MAVMICQAVLCFPSFSAERTRPFEAAMRRRPVMRNSRLTMMVAAQAGMALRGTRQMKAAAIMILSTRGSMRRPKSVSMWKRRAISPSA